MLHYHFTNRHCRGGNLLYIGFVTHPQTKIGIGTVGFCTLPHRDIFVIYSLFLPYFLRAIAMIMPPISKTGLDAIIFSTAPVKTEVIPE